jgi:hypothetical protein
MGANFWQKGPPPRVNYQKGPLLSEIDKKNHLHRGGKLAKRHVAPAATDYGGKLPQATYGTCRHRLWQHVLFIHNM